VVPGTALHHASISLASVPSRQILAEHLDADRRADAGGQHVDARLDRHRPGVGDAGELQRGVHSAISLSTVMPGRHSILPASG
jgi:hypothetical protein